MKSRIDRIVLPLDAVSDIATAIDTAARLAAGWRVPLFAVFIQEEDIWHLAGLPFARQFGVASGGEALTREHVEAHFRVFAERTREAVAAAAARHGAAASFVTVHGSLAAAELGEHDFVVASAALRPVGRHFRLPRPSRRPPDSPRSLLRARRDWQGGGAVLAIVRRQDPAGARLLALAAALAAFANAALHVFAAPDPEGIEGLRAWVADALAGCPLEVAVEISGFEPAELRRRLVAIDCRLIALADNDAEFEACFAECDVLLLGGGAGEPHGAAR